MVLGFLSTLVLGQGVLGTVVAVGTLLIFVLPAVMTVVIETTALRELSGQMADKLQEAADEDGSRVDRCFACANATRALCNTAFPTMNAWSRFARQKGERTSSALISEQLRPRGPYAGNSCAARLKAPRPR